MTRFTPDKSLKGYACSTVSASIAKGFLIASPDIREDGYLSLAKMNTFLRQHLPIKKKIVYKRGERPKLKEIPKRKAIVCVYGHYIYMTDKGYYSFFDNADDEVVCVWEIGE